MIAGLLVIDPSLKIMIVTKENVAAHAFVKHFLRLGLPESINCLVGRLVIQICGEHLNLLVNYVVKPTFGRSLLRFGFSTPFMILICSFVVSGYVQDINNEFMHVFIQIYFIDLEYELFGVFG